VRALFTCRPLTGHFRPLLPLAEACRQAGHEVAFATADPVAADAEREGFTALRVGLGPESRLQLLARHPDLDAIPRSELRATFFSELFVGIELAPRARALAVAVDEWKPDLLVHDVAELAAPLVAHSRRLPYASHGYGAMVPAPVVEVAAAAAEPIWRSFGVEPRPRAGLYEHLYVDVWPPSLQEADATGLGRVQQLRITERADVTSDRARWVAPGDERPLVYVTLGTVWNTKRDVFRAILDGLAGLDLVAIVTVGTQNDPAELGELPPNVSVERFIPQAELLPHCAAAIVHGGSGTLLGAIAEGVPLVLVPQGADQFSNAAKVAAAGAGLELLPEMMSSARVRESLERIIWERSFKAEAERIGAEIGVLPSPSQALVALESLVDGVVAG
jgi:UDP:flavonoid glycosyltransferase YjiC (YdhE family)